MCYPNYFGLTRDFIRRFSLDDAFRRVAHEAPEGRENEGQTTGTLGRWFFELASR
jgi:hypothetical protein